MHNATVCNHLYSMTVTATCGTVDKTLALLILISVAKSMGTTLLLAGAGYYMAKKGHLPKAATKGVGQYAKSFAIPCLLFHAMARGVDMAVLKHAWVMLLLPLVNCAFGTLIGTVASKVVGHAPGHRRVVQSCVWQSNSTGLPIVLIKAIMSGTVPSIVRTGSLTLGPAADPLVYHALYLMVYPIVQWSLGSLMLRDAARDIMAHHGAMSRPSASEPSSPSPPSSIKKSKMLAADPYSESLMSTSLMPSVYKMRGMLDGDDGAVQRVTMSQNPLTYTPRDYPNLADRLSSPRTPGTGLDLSQMSQMDITDILALSSLQVVSPPSQHRGAATAFATPPRISLHERAVVATAARMSLATPSGTDKKRNSANQSLISAVSSPAAFESTGHGADATAADEEMEWRSGVKALGTVFSSFIALLHHLLTPPTVGALLGITVGGVPTLHGLLVAESAPLRWIFNAIATIGEAAVPLQMLILGAKLAGEELFNLNTGLGIRPNVMIAFAKLGVMPIAGFSAAVLLPRLFSSFAHMPEPFDDAMWFVIVLLTCTPTANNLVVMADLVSAEMDDAIAEEEAAQGETAAAAQEHGVEAPVVPRIITPADAVAGALKVQYLLAPFALTISLTAALLMLSLDDAPTMVEIVPHNG